MLRRNGEGYALSHQAGQIIVSPAVADQLAVGQTYGIDVPDLMARPWIITGQPISVMALRLVTLALGMQGAVVVLDDSGAETLGTPLTGTLGLLLHAKGAGLIAAVEAMLYKLQALRFRLSAEPG